MDGIEALELLKDKEIIYRGYFDSESDQWFIKYNKETRSFSFGSGWNEALKHKTNEQILNFLFYTILHDHWNKKEF